MNTAPLTYAETRPRVMSGDVLAWSMRDGWFSSFHNFKVRVVRMFTSSEFDHNAVAWVIGGRVFALEAVMPLVRIYPLSKLGDFYWLPMGKWTPDAEEFALAHIGTPYSQAKAIRAFFGPVAHDEQEECA